MSAKLALYNAIKTKVLAMLDDQETPATIVKTFGHWNNQFDRINEEIQFLFPSVFIEFQSIDWKTDVGVDQKNQTQQQRGDCNVILHIGCENKKDESDSFPEDIAIIDSIHDQLNGLQGTQFTPLKRISENDDTNKNNIRHWQIAYNTRLHEKGYESNKTDATEGGTVAIKIITTGQYETE